MSRARRTRGKPKIKISFVTDWKAQGRTWWLLIRRSPEGLYAKRGLDVTIREGGAACERPQAPRPCCAADFGIGSNAFIPLNMIREGVEDQSRPWPVFQKDPQCSSRNPRGRHQIDRRHEGKAIMIGDASTVTFRPG
jgi:hypothetical protein